MDEVGLTGWLAGHSTVAGPIRYCAERLAEIEESGIDNVIVARFVPEPLRFKRECADKVVARLS
ncbi:hypothetical protein ACIBSV_20800 [Embleya sp. NPDC050154]|uniref:hypothetical protein n=1 Tax=unclassified Embleya TaxID=2699296 RepID=UPI003794DCDB